MKNYYAQFLGAKGWQVTSFASRKARDSFVKNAVTGSVRKMTAQEATRAVRLFKMPYVYQHEVYQHEEIAA